jgi:hypothetical protein
MVQYEIISGNYLCCTVPRTNFFNLSLSIPEMGRPSYVCTVCSEHFTRKYSARRHNHNLHNGAAEIVRLIDYLAGRSSGQYMPNNPFWYKHNNPYHNFGSATVADSVGDTFQPRYLPRQATVGTTQYSASPMHPPRQIIDDQSYGNGLSQGAIQKIQELKRLVNKYRHYQNSDPDEIVKWAINGALKGDTQFLDKKLEQLHMIEFSLKYCFG